VKGVKNGRLPSKKIRLYDFGRHPRKTFPGDGTGTGEKEEEKQKTGPGPNKREVTEASRKKSL
jgi:hypothetical protein